jgi:hypothetical protein
MTNQSQPEYFSRQATVAEIRAEYKTDGYEVRISTKTGEVRYRRTRDRFPGCRIEWLLGGHINDFRYYSDIGVIRP